MNDAPHAELATLAGGCFWCMEPPFDALDGVLATEVGYAGGTVENPSYEQVCSGQTGHAEVVQVSFDPRRIGYGEILEVFWRQIDPTAENRQFADRGSQYRTAIFYHDERQRRIAEASKQALARSGRFQQPIVTEIVPFTRFYPAEANHQKYYRSNPLHYKLYRSGSGREHYLRSMWGADNNDD